MFITFEGLDLSGKSTQARLLLEYLQKVPAAVGFPRRPVQFIREPGGTQIAERVREILLDKKHLEMTGVAEMLLFSASRAQLVSEVILPALHRGEFVICDRYVDSTTAYQGYGRGIDRGALKTVNRLATQGRMPDLTFLVDIPVDEIERRKTRAGFVFDRMESSGKEFFERVRAGYVTMAKEEPQRWVSLDGLEPISEIHKRVLRAVNEKSVFENQHNAGVVR